jgi:MFS family permease
MTDAPTRTPVAAWRMLALGVAAQAAGTMLVSTPAYLIPLLHLRGLSLAEAGLLAGAPTLGMVLTLVAWGALADRFGERWVIAGGLALTALFAFAASLADGYVWLGILLGLGGAASASTNAASGRVVVGWFPRSRRGLAMGIRQMSQPLGVAVAALVVPPLADAYGIAAPFLLAGASALVLAAACAVGIRNPPRPARPAAGDVPGEVNPYSRDRFLVRIHLLSALLVVPQFTLSTFGLVWLTAGLGWQAAIAGGLIAAAQFVGAIGRIVIGVLSDRLGTRVRVIRWVAASGAAAMLLLALVAAGGSDAAAAVLLVIASTISVADNGLAFTSVAEAAGPAWAGRALGIQNTGQFVAASAVGPAVGAFIGAVGYPVAFAAVAVAPLVAVFVTPHRDRQWAPPAAE